jgi:hypothetical protein
MDSLQRTGAAIADGRPDRRDLTWPVSRGKESGPDVNHEDLLGNPEAATTSLHLQGFLCPPPEIISPVNRWNTRAVAQIDHARRHRLSSD